MLSFNAQLDAASLLLRQGVERARAISADPKTPSEPTALEALAYNLERAAWGMIELAQAWVFELRLGLPRKETESFDLLQRHGWLDLETARRYKQLCEFRSLSRRESDRVDWQYLSGDLSAEFALLLEWDAQARAWQSKPREAL